MKYLTITKLNNKSLCISEAYIKVCLALKLDFTSIRHINKVFIKTNL